MSMSRLLEKGRETARDGTDSESSDKPTEPSASIQGHPTDIASRLTGVQSRLDPYQVTSDRSRSLDEHRAPPDGHPGGLDRSRLISDGSRVAWIHRGHAAGIASYLTGIQGCLDRSQVASDGSRVAWIDRGHAIGIQIALNRSLQTRRSRNATPSQRRKGFSPAVSISKPVAAARKWTSETSEMTSSR